MSDRRPLEAAIHRQLAIVWSAGVTSAQHPPTVEPTEFEIRVATRQKIIDDAAGEILRAIERRER